MTTEMVIQDRVHKTRAVLSGLETLRQEHQLLLSSSSIDDGKRPCLEQSLESIDLDIAETGVLLQLEHHLNDTDIETYRLMLQVQRLTQENDWLRNELSITEKNLETSTESKKDFEREIRLLNEALAETRTEENFTLTGSIDIDKEMPIDSKETVEENHTDNPNEAKNHSEVPARFRTLHNLVLQYAQAGRYEVAVPLCRQALEDLEKTHGHFHPDVATMLNILALVYRDQNKFKEALHLLTEALTIREKTLGLEHQAVAATLNNIAVLYGKKNRYKEAEPLCKRALDIRIKCFGPNHPDVAKQLNNLALLCLNQGKFSQVEEYYKRAIEIYRKNYGDIHPAVAKTKNNLASSYLREGKYKLAAQLYQEVLSSEQGENNQSSVNNSTASPRDASTVMITLKNLGAICRRQGLYEQADFIETCATKSTHDPQAINQALSILRQVRIHDDNNQLTTRRPQQVPNQDVNVRNRRSGSFQRLRQSIRRGSEKLVQKLRGTSSNNWNNTPNNQPQPQPQPQQQQQQHQFEYNRQRVNYEPMKRASSMSTLNNTSTQQYQPSQIYFNRSATVEHHHQYQHQPINYRRRLSSAENLYG